jgi:HK97 family phage major capsid protein
MTDTALPMRLYARPIAIMETMPTIAQNAFPILYGDLRRAYMIVDRIGISVQIDPYTQNTTDTIRFLARRRVGGQVIVPEAVAVLKVSA